MVWNWMMLYGLSRIIMNDDHEIWNDKLERIREHFCNEYIKYIYFSLIESLNYVD